MNPVEIILAKRNGEVLNREQIKFFVNSYLDGTIPEYQMSSLLMAIFFKGMTPEEVQTLTEIYINSGEKITFPKEMLTVDKHSTGGVGDKISIVLAPIVAACGVKIPMISGRGLGHTGGTLDKLESIPGFETSYTSSQFKKMVNDIGMAIISQTDKLVPADKNIYALRDVTATVESLPLITASIMSKKIAEGAHNLVIDLKVGSGAFIKNLEDAKKLSRLLIDTGTQLNQKVSVIFTNMNAPIGNYIGNALEIYECVQYLKNKESASDLDLITKELAVEMLLLGNKAKNRKEALKKIENVLTSGKALKMFRQFIENQNGSGKIIDNPEIMRNTDFKLPIKSDREGWIHKINSQMLGYSLIMINAGRTSLNSELDHSTGAYLDKKIGDYIEKDQTLGYVYCNNKQKGKKVSKRILKAISIEETKISKEKIILGIEKD